MQTKALIAMVASAVLTASASAGSVPVFNVTNFHTLCTGSVPHNCTSSFNVSVNAEPAVGCHIKWSATSYVLCGIIGAEQAYSAYIEKPTHKKGLRTLDVKFSTSFPGRPVDSIIGNKTLNHPKSHFTFPGTEETED